MPSLSSLPRSSAWRCRAWRRRYNLAFWLVRSRPDAEDIVQEAYLRALRAFDGFHGEDMRPWLLAIVRNTAYRWLNNRRRSGSVDLARGGLCRRRRRGHRRQRDRHRTSPRPRQRLIGAAERDYVLRALAELPPAFREVLVLREIEDLSYRDIAEVTGAPIGTVMSRLSRGRGELRKVLTRLIEKDEPNAM